MNKLLQNLVRSVCGVVMLSGLFMFSASQAAAIPAPAFEVEHDKWYLASIPSSAPERVSDVFDELLGFTYGSGWVIFVYEYSTASNSGGYRIVELDEFIQPGVGFWFLQRTGTTQIINFDGEELEERTSRYVSSRSTTMNNIWTIMGSPSPEPIDVADIIYRAPFGSICASFQSRCKLNEFRQLNNIQFTYEQEDGYKVFVDGVSLEPWQGAWTRRDGGLQIYIDYYPAGEGTLPE